MLMEIMEFFSCFHCRVKLMLEKVGLCLLPVTVTKAESPVLVVPRNQVGLCDNLLFIEIGFIIVIKLVDILGQRKYFSFTGGIICQCWTGKWTGMVEWTMELTKNFS